MQLFVTARSTMSRSYSSSAKADLFLKLQEQIKCPVCLEIFVNPRSLSCQHVFCKECIDQVYDKRKEIKCPTCRVTTAMPREGSASLPIAFHINSLLDLYESEAIVDGATREGESCEVCPVHGRALEVYCSTCEEVVCTLCGIPR